ncbi:MAG: hypothetical protein FWG96_05550 [Methanomassiliicoccaceae archaeon]|nr:hypothetical protein [Methanomassiliicoccaceae archaeon]
MRKLSPKNMDTVPSIEDIESPAAVTVACIEIRRFLTDIITKKDTDVVISTLRKGSWIIDDIIKIRNLKVIHYTNENIEKVPSTDLLDKNILIFDDSIHSGQSVINVLSKINKTDDVRAACITINDEALEKIEECGIEIEYLEKFKDYYKYGDNGELIPGCQAYYYAYFMMPYISNLSVNYSPDYKSLSISVEGGLPKDLKSMTDSIISAIEESCQNSSYEVDNTMYTRRVSLHINGKCLCRYLSELKIPYETDISKLRISASIYGNYSEIVVTPMFCPICEDVDGIDLKNLPFLLSERFIADNCGKIINSLTTNGFSVVKKNIIVGTAGNNDAQLR